MSDIFLCGAQTVLLNLIYKNRSIDVQKYCEAILKLTSDFYGFKILSVPNFTEIIEDINTQTKVLSVQMPPPRYGDDFQIGLSWVRLELPMN